RLNDENDGSTSQHPALGLAKDIARKSKTMPNEDVAAYFMKEVGQTWSPALKTLIAVSLLKESGL
ncbi:unnamed protein product, partial [Pylaiella littoralis]